MGVSTVSGRRYLPAALTMIATIAACGSPPAQAQTQTQTWQVTAADNGFRVAKVTGNSGIISMGFVCERTVPLLALRLARAPARTPALISLTNGTAVGKFGIARNGTTNTWAGPVRDTRVLAMLAREASIEVAIDGVRYGTVSLAGAGAAMKEALAGCYTATGATVAQSGGAKAGEFEPFDGKPMAVADTSSPVTIQTSFPTRDPRTGGLRLPVRLGTYVLADVSCARSDAKRKFIGLGGGPQDAMNDVDQESYNSSIQSIRMTKPGTYVTREQIDTQDQPLYQNYTYVIADPEHFTVSSAGEKMRRYSYCPQSSLPIEHRKFMEAEYRQVLGLPIAAGYYKIWATEDVPPKFSCVESCGYMLLTKRGMAITDRYDGGANGQVNRRSTLFVRFTQDAPLHYTVKGNAQDEFVEFTMDGKGGFTIAPDGLGSPTHTQRIDPKSIPPAMMPRF